MKAPDDRISYAIICDKFPIPQTRFTTYDLAVKWAKLDQPNHRPFYIVKCTEHFEICKEANAIDELPSAQKKGYTKADYIMALHKEYGCSLARAKKAHRKALEYLRNTSMMKG